MFKVGDHVERIGALIPTYMRDGVVTKVIPNEQGMEWFNQYQINFSDQVIAMFYESQLRRVKPLGGPLATTAELD